jgi:type I restriction enzyme S subunit
LHGTPKYNKHGEYHFINGNNLSEGKIIIKKETKSCSEEEYLKYKKKLNSRTILVSINGSLGYFAFYNNEKCFSAKSQVIELHYSVSKCFKKIL